MTAHAVERELRLHAPDCPVRGRTTVDLFGVRVDPLDMQSTVDTVAGFVACGLPHQHVCLNAAKVVELDRSPELAEAISACDLVNVDGQAVVWASRWLAAPVPERVAGVDLYERLLSEAAERGWGVYFLGARPEVVEAVVDRVRRELPALRVAGARSGYWASDEEQAVVDAVAASDAQLLFLAIPSPRKELFLATHGEALGVPFRMGVGGSFDVYAGRTKRAPVCMRRIGMEWAFRLLQEPRRMVKRYLVGNSSFVLLTLRKMRTGA